MIAVSSFGDVHYMGVPTIEKIYPKASELSEILNYNPCPECSEVFHNTPNLDMHLAKFHGRESRPTIPREGNVVRQFYCPATGCKYSGDRNKEFGPKFFTQHKYLKQHYIKVHMEKKYVCEQCGKGFATVQLRKRHMEECGMKFVCSCGAEYNTIPALLTHASRKQHTFVKSWPAVRTRKTDKNDNTSAPKQNVIMRKAKPYDSIVAKTAVALSELSCKKSVDIGVQTEATGGHRRRRNTSRQTQTGEKRTRISSETQTVGESKRNAGRRRKKSMETQTKVVEHTVVSDNNNSSFDVKQDIQLAELWFNSGTQTSTETIFENPLQDLCRTFFDEEPDKVDDQTNIFSNVIIKEEIKDHLLSSLAKSDIDEGKSCSNDQFFPAFLKEDDGKSCSIETQTESLFDNYNTDTLNTIETQTSHDMWDQYNNMYTQTCDDLTSFQACDDFLLAFSDIETQTAWPELLSDNQ